MADLRVLVANCLVAGDKITHRDDSWVRNIVEFVCSGQVVVFTQSDLVAKGSYGNLTGRFCETSDVLISNVPPSRLQRTLRLIDRLCWLLSFASMSHVLWYGYDYPAGSPTGLRRSVSGAVNDFRPVFDVRDTSMVQSFIEQAYPAYEQLEISRKLHVVIDYLVRADMPGQPTEFRLLLAFVTLESLKDTYARSRGIPYVAGAFRKGPNPSRKSAKYGFEELLKAMLKDVRMRRGLKTIVRLRNEIVHSGISRLSHKSQSAIYGRAQDLIREYLLRLLGYHGSYLTYASAGNATSAV